MTLLHPRVGPTYLDGPGAEALIREARRLRRRRWLIGLAVLVALGGSGLGYGLASSGVPPSKTATGHAMGPGPVAPPVVARWVNLSAEGGLPAGAQVTSVVRFDGHYLATGAYFGSGPVLAALGCYVGCNPAVWTSGTVSHWNVALAVDANGGTADEQLVTTPRGLLLFQTDEGTRLWRSTNGESWQRVRLPSDMAALGAVGATWSHGRAVAVLNNKFAGGPGTAYGESDMIWTSTNGATWRQDAVPGAPSFGSVTATASGFLAGGTSRTTGRPTLWRSTNGLTWTTSTLGTGHGTALVAANDRVEVAEVTKGAGSKGTDRLWWLDKSTWRPAVVRGGPIPATLYGGTGATIPLLATSVSFIASGTNPTELWSSSSGSTWSRVTEKDAPSTADQVQALFPDGVGLLAVVAPRHTPSSASAPTTSIWHITLGGGRW